jgi:hypothetical protein
MQDTKTGETALLLIIKEQHDSVKLAGNFICPFAILRNVHMDIPCQGIAKLKEEGIMTHGIIPACFW